MDNFCRSPGSLDPRVQLPHCRQFDSPPAGRSADHPRLQPHRRTTQRTVDPHRPASVRGTGSTCQGDSIASPRDSEPQLPSMLHDFGNCARSHGHNSQSACATPIAIAPDATLAVRNKRQVNREDIHRNRNRHQPRAYPESPVLMHPPPIRPRIRLTMFPCISFQIVLASCHLFSIIADPCLSLNHSLAHSAVKLHAPIACHSTMSISSASALAHDHSVLTIRHTQLPSEFTGQLHAC